MRANSHDKNGYEWRTSTVPRCVQGGGVQGLLEVKLPIPQSSASSEHATH